MAQHPGDGSDRRDRQSVFIHLLGLCAALEHAQPPQRIASLHAACVRSARDFPALRRPDGPGQVTVVHMILAGGAEDHDRRAREWAASVWESWSAAQPRIRAAVGQII